MCRIPYHMGTTMIMYVVQIQSLTTAIHTKNKTTNTNIHNSVPPEFRRARICNEEDVRLHPEKNCTTFATWKKEMAQYYKDGGGVEFDFSIEGKGGGPPQKYLMGD